ncbi:MAG: 6-carboxytetrahydropterin synthase [Planctomycetota bacterium]|nr:6-carboxytetrahydropterin synthase [Planctomycetota bacterium]
MYEIAVSAEFCAAHALSILGAREPVHGHNFRVVATVAGDVLDADGLLCDFHTVQETLESILSELDNRNLDELEPFAARNASAENIAAYIATELGDRLDAFLAPAASVRSVSVTEAPGCVATYLVSKQIRPGNSRDAHEASGHDAGGDEAVGGGASGGGS